LNILFFSSIINAQSSFQFEIESEDDAIVINAEKDAFGNTIVIGLIGSYIEYIYDAYILKVHQDGSYISKRFDFGDTTSVFTTINALENGNYFVVGSYNTESNFLERNHLWVLILDPDLNILTQKSYLIRDPYTLFGVRFCSLIDNKGDIITTAIVAKEDKNGKTLFSDFAFYKFNQQGDTLLSKYYSYIWDEVPYTLTKVPGSDNLMLIERCTQYNNHYELMFLDTNLEILKINNWPSVEMSDNLCSDHWISDTSFLVSGYGYPDFGNKSYADILVHLMDTSAIVHQELILGKTDTVDYTAWQNNMAYANDSTIYICGFQAHIALWSLEPSVVELYVIDKNLNLLGYKEFGGDIYYEVWGSIATDDGGCLMYGICRTNDTIPERDIRIWKVLREDINIITTIEFVELADISVNAWPNPCQNELNIGIEAWNRQGQIRLQIFNASGKKMTDRVIEGEGNLLRVNVTNLKRGAYIYQVYLPDGNTVHGKFIKQ
jgi:hypothetical protein